MTQTRDSSKTCAVCKTSYIG